MNKVSVCLATHNGERYIQEQIDSILTQLGENDELIISDDGSTDTTISIISSYSDKRLKLAPCKIRNDTVKNFENALLHSSGDIIFLSDQDDLWRENKLEIMKKELQTYDLVLSDCIVANENLEPLEHSLFKIQNTQLGVWRNIWKNGFVGCCMAFRRSILQKALPFPENIPMHDQWIGLVGNMFFKPKLNHEKLIYFRRHDKSASMTGKKSNLSLYRKIAFRLNLIKNLGRLYL